MVKKKTSKKSKTAKTPNYRSLDIPKAEFDKLLRNMGLPKSQKKYKRPRGEEVYKLCAIRTTCYPIWSGSVL